MLYVVIAIAVVVIAYVALKNQRSGDRSEVKEMKMEPKEKKLSHREETASAADRESAEKQEMSKTPEKISDAKTPAVNSAHRAVEQKADIDVGEKASDQHNEAANESVSEEDSVDAQEKAALKVLYQYVNKNMKQMYECYETDSFDAYTDMFLPEEDLSEMLEKVSGRLSEESAALIRELRAYAEITDTEDGKTARITDQEGLCRWFERQMLPFYPMYHQTFAGKFRYTTFADRPILKLLHQLTGRKYRLGFHNRYKSGESAFTYHQGYYRVYDENGHMLCDACFAEGKIKKGYGRVNKPELSGEDWKVSQEGYFEDGEFQSGAIRYDYQKPVV